MMHSYIYFGGSFDPVHRAHMAIATHINNQLNDAPTPTQFFFLPTAGSPLKNTQTHAAERLDMLRLALSDTKLNANINIDTRIDTREINKTPPVYSIDTLTQLRRELGFDVSIIFVLGLDSLAGLHQWKKGDKLLDFCHFWVFHRHLKTDQAALDTLDKKSMTKCVPDNLKNHLVDDLNMLLTHSHGYIFLDSYQPPNISSTQIRCHINDAKHLLNSKVWAYIKTNALYIDSPQA